MLRTLVLVAVAGGVAGSTPAQTPGFVFLDTEQSYGVQVSANGSVVKWYREASNSTVRRGWAEQDEVFANEFYPGMSNSGRILTGFTNALGVDDRRATYRDGLNPRRILRNGAFGTWAFAATDDGRWVFGASDLDPSRAAEREFATVWDTQTGVPTVLFREQYASRLFQEGGGVAVGYYVDGALNGVPFAWTPETGPTLLNTLGYASVGAEVVSPDGSIIVGTATQTGFSRNLIVWDENGATDWGTFSTFSTRPVAVSNTGLIALLRDGVSGPPSLVWDQAGGLRTLNDHLASLSISVPSDWTLRVAGISADGRTFVGDAVQGSLNRAFIVTVPTPSCLACVLGFASLITRQRRRA